MNTQKLGGLSALAQVAISIANMIVALVVLPMMGFENTTDLADPAQAIALKTPLLALELFKIASAVVIGVTFISVGRCLRVRAPIAINVAAISGGIGVALLLLGGVIGIVTLHQPGAPASSVAGLINTSACSPSPEPDSGFFYQVGLP